MLKLKGIQSSFGSSHSFLNLHFSLDIKIGMNSCAINFCAIVRYLVDIIFERLAMFRMFKNLRKKLKKAFLFNF